MLLLEILVALAPVIAGISFAFMTKRKEKVVEILFHIFPKQSNG